MKTPIYVRFILCMIAAAAFVVSAAKTLSAKVLADIDTKAEQVLNKREDSYEQVLVDFSAAERAYREMKRKVMDKHYDRLDLLNDAEALHEHVRGILKQEVYS